MILPATDDLEAFLLGARLLNFRAAASAASVTPAALGKRIQRLERQLGKRLFERTTRRVELTDAGRALLPHAGRLLEVARECVRAARGDTEPPPCELVLGTRHELGLSWIVPMLDDLRAEHPHVTLHLYFGSGPDLEVKVRTADVDLAVTSRRPSDRRISSLDLHEERYVFVGSRALLRSQPLRRPEDAARHTLIDAAPERPLYRYFSDAPGGGDRLPFARALSMGTIAAIHTLVLARRGVAVLPQYLVRKDLERGRLARVFPEVALASDRFRLIFRGDDPRRGLFQKLAESLRRHPLT